MATSRTELRRRVARAIREPFFRDVTDSADADTGTGAGVVVATSALRNFWGDDDEWNNSWVYFTSGNAAGEERRAYDYTASNGQIDVAPDYDSAPSSGDSYEIHSRVSAEEKHHAINRAIRQAWPHFFTETEKEIVIPDDVAELTSTEQLPSWRRLNKVFLEPASGDVSDEYTATGATSTTVTVSGAGWTTDEWQDQEVRIFKGTGLGQVRTVQSNTSDTVTVSSSWDTNPSTDSEFVFYDVSEVVGSWSQVADVWPIGGNSLSRLLLPTWMQQAGWVKYKLRLHGANTLSTLSSDSDTVDDDVAEYIVYQAASILLMEFVTDTPHETNSDEQFLARWYSQEAERFKKEHAMQHTNGTLWQKPTGVEGGRWDGWWPSSPMSSYSY